MLLAVGLALAESENNATNSTSLDSGYSVTHTASYPPIPPPIHTNLSNTEGMILPIRSEESGSGFTDREFSTLQVCIIPQSNQRLYRIVSNRVNVISSNTTSVRCAP
jgi:hypothetical protein